MLLTPPPAVLAHSTPFAASPRTPACYVPRSCPDRRKTEGFAPPGCTERRVQAERRGIRLVEFDFDERITIGTPRRRSATA